MPKSSKRQKLIVSSIFLFCFSYLALMTQRFQFRMDGGIPLHVAQRMMGGEVLYKDIFEFWMPGTFYLLYGAFRIFGTSFFIVRALMFVNLVVITFLLYLIGLKLTKKSILAALGLVVFILLIPNHLCYNHNWLGLTGLLSTTYLILRRKEGVFSKGQNLVIGIVSGLTLLFSQWIGGVIIIACLWLILTEKADSLIQNATTVFIYLIGIGLVAVPWLIYFYRLNLLPYAWKAVVLFPLFNYPRGNTGLGISLLWLALTLFYLLFFLRDKKKDGLVKYPLQIVSSIGLIFYLTSFINTNRGHTFFVFTPAIPLLIYYLGNVVTKMFPEICLSKCSSPSQSKCRIVKLSAVFYLLVLLAVDFGFTKLPVMNYYLRDCYEVVSTSRGNLYTDSFSKQNIREILHFLNEECDKGEFVYIGPYNSYYYFISAVKNPLRYSYLTNQHFTDSIFQEVVNDLKSKRVNKIIFLPSVSYSRGDERDLLVTYILDNFTPIKVFDPPFWPQHPRQPADAIWVRKENF